MATRSRKVVSLLACVQNAAERRRTNPYQIAKATGLPLRSIQKLLAQRANPTLKNIQVILDGFGLSLYVLKDGRPTIKPGKKPAPRQSSRLALPAPPRRS